MPPLLNSNQSQSGEYGLTLTASHTVVYFSNTHSLKTRLQSEDRAHRKGSEIHEKITYVDLIARNTYDEKIVNILRARKNIADLITGDNIRQWI